MQGAEINSSNNNYYGDGYGNGGTSVNTITYSTTLRNYAGGHLNNANFTAGNYEYVVAAGPVASGSVPITSGLVNSYYNANYGTQGQRRFPGDRVPQYRMLPWGGTLTALPWDGATGGSWSWM